MDITTRNQAIIRKLFALLIAISYLVVAACFNDNEEHPRVIPLKCSEFDSTHETCSSHEKCSYNFTCGSLADVCYTVWSEAGNKSTVIKQGCIPLDSSQEECFSSSCSGRFATSSSKTMFFCCCNENYCNTQFSRSPYLLPEIDPRDVVPTFPTVRQFSNSYLFLAVPAVIVVLLLPLMYCVARKKACFNPRKLPLSPTRLGDLDQSCLCPPVTKIEVIASGRFGCVWRGTSGNSTVAIKVFSAKDRDSWRAEKDIYMKFLMNHPNILLCLGAGKDCSLTSPEYHIITEYHPLGSLNDYLHHHVLSWEQLCTMLAAVARGLAYIHSHNFKSSPPKPAMAHRDIKGNNILVRNDLTCCISDFGLTVVFEDPSNPGTQHAQVGTRRYMAPEVLEGFITFTPESFFKVDIYAYSLVAWEAATRCSAVEAANTFKMAFEQEVGISPTLEAMYAVVLRQRQRPIIKQEWMRHPGLRIICELIEESWDQDAEARLSAQCILSRLEQLQRDCYDLKTTNNRPVEERKLYEFPEDISAITPLLGSSCGPHALSTIT